MVAKLDETNDYKDSHFSAQNMSDRPRGGTSSTMSLPEYDSWLRWKKF